MSSEYSDKLSSYAKESLNYYINVSSTGTGDNISTYTTTGTGGSYTYTTSPTYTEYGTDYSTVNDIESLKTENWLLREEINNLKGQLSFLMSKMEELSEVVTKDAKIIKLSSDDKMFNDLLDDILEEDD